ncbi:MAG: DNA polymerase III subunit alpha [Planctomycetota bacterium]
MDFSHLHVHSHYTLLESTLTVDRLVAAVKDRGMDAVALTDRTGMFGALEFSTACAKAGITGIVGCQVNVAPLGMTERTPDRMQLVLLAQNPDGYHNLARLVSEGWLEGFYYEARVDLERIARYAEGLVCLTGAGPDGFLNRHLLAGATEEARRQAQLLHEIFGDRLFIEITDHGVEGPINARGANIELARDLGLPPVATNWVHYLDQRDHEVHEVQLAVQKVTTLSDPRRKRMPSDQFYLKTPDEMACVFADLPEALANTRKVVELCSDCAIPTGTYHLPHFACPDNLSDTDYVRQQCEAGLIRRYGDQMPEGARERLDFELATIEKMGFAAYFLIVADFINWAKSHGVPVGPGRGSAAGSLVAYAMGITDICPLRYGLLFERFLNPGRKSMPDIDIDFCKDGRGRVIDYVAEKYGRQAVTQIMTLGTMKARMAIKDVARAYEWTPEEAQDLANLVPEDPGGKHTIPVCLGKKALKDGSYDASERMVARYENDDRTHRVLDTAAALENLGRSLGVHACGVIIAPGPVHHYVPVCQVKGKPATQYDMVEVETCGLLKMDFLGLKTMSILKKAADIAAATAGVQIDYPELPLDDAQTFALLGSGETLGVFQCESGGFQELIKMLQPDRFEDMIALVALYRPGPLMAGMHIDYCERKHGRQKVEFPHPVLESVLEETYGLYIYQEQVMNIARELSGFTPSQADDLRKAMGKKKLDVLEKLKPLFIDGAWELHQYPKDKCEAMWENILGFASYCFNKSHSACYGLIAYWTAYMKARHYAAFMTANLIYEMENKDKMTLFSQELQRHGVPVLPPDINESGWEFTFTGEAVRFGFGGVKGVGHQAAEHLMHLREQDGPFVSLFDLCERIDTRCVNKRVIEHLIKVGALDTLHRNRRALCEAIDIAFDRGSRIAKNRSQQQATLFDTFEQDETFRAQTQSLPDVPDWALGERLAFEKALTGYWMSSHPLSEHAEIIARHASHVSRDLARRPPGSMTIAAVVIAKREIKTRSGKPMAVLTLEDDHGRFEAVLFAGRNNRRGEFEAGAYDRFAADCDPDLIALFTGKADRRERRRSSAPPPELAGDGEDPGAAGGDATEPEELPSLIVEEMVPVELVHERLTREVVIAVDALETQSEQRIAGTATLLKEHPGHCPVSLAVQTDADVLLTLAAGDRWRIHPTAELITGLRAIWGERAVTTVTGR